MHRESMPIYVMTGFPGSGESALLAEVCVCCNGLPALNETLELLFWARLHRSIPRFGMVSAMPFLMYLFHD
ncbi:hypothetical protein B0G75_12633 [Paraburkholderia sp. BL18I3N2]|uniref:hypothetical protein n=1 Tax=Paraburkholderia sp. BL18I3N2 TaxID=1938799 RepID=UPI000D4927F5|nr:hypothetical protein [Paraburkholderia sp. BL18I3N2]PRX23073.1 hypothetical protein B0G75_12633 [Paraburkholderia sp. BL18I3N2]